MLPESFNVDSRVGFVATSIGKMVPIMPAKVSANDPLEVWGEAYNQILADEKGFVSKIPEIEGLVLKKNFEAYVDRKLFIHNLGHAASAYFGFLSGKTFIWECMADNNIQKNVRLLMLEAGQALIKSYPTEFNKKNMEEHIEDLLRRFSNKMLGDTVFRVGRDLSRKLSADDRCIGALRLIVESEGNVNPVCDAIAASLCFKATDEKGNYFPEDEKFCNLLKSNGINFILENICKLDPTKDIEYINNISLKYKQLLNNNE